MHKLIFPLHQWQLGKYTFVCMCVIVLKNVYISSVLTVLRHPLKVQKEKPTQTHLVFPNILSQHESLLTPNV